MEEKEHPEDRRMHEEGEKYGRDHAAEFVKHFAISIERLIGVYPDDKAHAALDILREKFWARSWKPKGKGRP